MEEYKLEYIKSLNSSIISQEWLLEHLLGIKKEIKYRKQKIEKILDKISKNNI